MVIANPAARRGLRGEAEARRACARLGLACDVHRTTAPGDAARLAAELAPTLGPGDLLFALGGDGTLVEAVGALSGQGVPVAILAGGTGNQLARFFGVPLRIGRAIEAYAAGSAERTIDLGDLGGGRRFAITAGLGMDAQMILGAPSRAKRRFGVAAYLWSAGRAVLAARTFRVRIEADGDVLERDAGVAMVANVGSLLDRRVHLGPGIVEDDGWLDLVVLAPRGLRDALVLTWRMLRRDYRADPRVLFRRVRRVRLEPQAGVHGQYDGELLAPGPLEVRVVPAGGRFLLPAR